MTAMLELGAFLGCFFMPWLADKISRKWALSVVVIIFCIGAIIQTAAPNYGTLVFGRFFGGIGVGTLALVRFRISFPVPNPLLISPGRPAVHFRDRSAASAWRSTGARVRVNRTWRCRGILDNVCYEAPGRRHCLPPAVRPSDGLRRFPRHLHSLFPLQPALAGSCWS